MRVPAWSRDTIARRIGLAVILAVAVSLGLIQLFTSLAGVWAQDPLDQSGLLVEAADIARMIDAAPVAARPHLAAAATSATSPFRISWHEADSPAAALLASVPPPRDVKLLARIQEEILLPTALFTAASPAAAVIDQASAPTGPAGLYFLAFRFEDASWLVFTGLRRSWGLSASAQLTIKLSFLVFSIALVSWVAARKLSRPIVELADAAQSFGSNPQAPPMAETGPREMRQVIAAFNAMQAQIQKFVAYRATMLAAISHDLRTPLTRMRLRGEYIDDPEQQARLFRDVDEMQMMIDGALAFFRDDTATEETVIFDLPGVLHTIINDFADMGVEIDYSGPVRASYRGRPFALKRAVTNLIENAIKYATPPGLALSVGAESLVLCVNDQGPGIPPASLDRVFNPYYRLDKSRNRTTGGVGLGLTSAQAIIRGHGGDISLHNRAEGGLEARVVLPVINPASTI